MRLLSWEPVSTAFADARSSTDAVAVSTRNTGFAVPPDMICTSAVPALATTDTGEVERQIRRVATLRATWVFSGSDAGATRMMLASSLGATCRTLGLDPWRYLRAVFTAIAEGRAARQLAEHWTFWAWARQPNAQETLAVAS
ncbi:MAG: Transposase [Myxococcaceae bacterium]|nr:Transposase [Myxococcaceae bacterium]